MKTENNWDSGKGKKTKLFTTSVDALVPNTDIEDAIKRSLNDNGLLAEGTSAYIVNAELMKIKAPFMGANMKVVSNIRYKVSETSTNKIVLDEIVTEAHTTKFNEAFFGAERGILAMEGSIGANISEFIKRMVKTIGGDEIMKADDTLIISFKQDCHSISSQKKRLWVEKSSTLCRN